MKTRLVSVGLTVEVKCDKFFVKVTIVNFNASNSRTFM